MISNPPKQPSIRPERRIWCRSARAITRIHMEIIAHVTIEVVEPKLGKTKTEWPKNSNFHQMASLIARFLKMNFQYEKKKTSLVGNFFFAAPISSKVMAQMKIDGIFFLDSRSVQYNREKNKIEAHFDIPSTHQHHGKLVKQLTQREPLVCLWWSLIPFGT